MATRRCPDPDAVLRRLLIKALSEHGLTPEDVAVTDDLVDGTAGAATANEEDLTEPTSHDEDDAATEDYTVDGVPPSPEPAAEPDVGALPAKPMLRPAPKPASGKNPAPFVLN